MNLRLHFIPRYLLAGIWLASSLARADPADYNVHLPWGWIKTERLKADFAAMPDPPDGRVFAIVVERAPLTPIPRELDEESSFEKSFWSSFTKRAAARGRFEIVDNSFAMIGGVPFRVVDGVRHTAKGDAYCELAMTPVRGECYALMTIKKGKKPEEDADLQRIVGSFSFTQPPTQLWYQPLLHYADDIFGLPLVLVAAGLGIYLLLVWNNPAVLLKRQRNVALWMMILLMINWEFIAGDRSAVGIFSLLFSGVSLLALSRVQKRMKLAGQDILVTPVVRQRLRSRFYLVIGFSVVALVIGDLKILKAGTSVWALAVPNLIFVCVFGIIFWSMRKKFFPPST